MSDLMISDGQKLMRAELDVQITTAKAYPRKAQKFIEEATLLATMDEETAESCFYCLPRGKGVDKKEIKGPSIRLAEIAASCWGNLHAGTRILDNDGKFITAEAVAWDLEKNVKISTQVKRRITYSNGGTYTEDMQQVTGAAASAIALRNAIFKVLPKSLIDRVYDAAVKFAVGDQKTINTKRSALFQRFFQMGISQEKILNYLDKKSINEVDIEEITSLIGIGTAIKDGFISIDRAFDLTEEDQKLSPKERLQNKLNNKEKAIELQQG